MQALFLEGLVPAHWWVELGLVSLVGRAMPNGVFSGLLWTQEDLGCLMGGAVFPSGWLFGLRHPSTAVNRLLGGARSY